MPRKIEISHRTIIFTVVLLLALWLLYQIRQIILAVFIAVILMSSLSSTVDRLEKWRLPRWGAILLLYLVFLALLGAVVSFIVPPLIDQTINFINRSENYLRQLSNFGLDPNLLASQFAQLGLVPANLLRIAGEIFANLFSLIFVAVVTFYLLLERKNLKRYLTILFGKEKEAVAEDFVNKIERQLGGWVRGEVILMTTIGVLTYVGLRVLGVDFALPLAILSGLLEILPNFGPIISAAPAVLIGFTVSPLMGVAVTALYFLIHQLENSLIAPKVLQRAVGVNPLIIILSLAIGLGLGGTIGAILAVPAVLIIKVVIQQFLSGDGLKSL